MSILEQIRILYKLTNKNGQLGKYVYLCLQEISGQFGLRIEDDVIEMIKGYPNIFVECSASGKLNKPHLLSWMKNCMSKRF